MSKNLYLYIYEADLTLILIGCDFGLDPIWKEYHFICKDTMNELREALSNA